MSRRFSRGALAAAVLGLAALTQVAQAGTSSYEYDPLGRLTKVTEPDGTVITYTYDPAGNRTQHVTTNGANQAPTAVADSVSTTAGTALTFNPLVNDTDPNGDALIISAVTQPPAGSGTVTIGSGGLSLTYTAPAGVSGAKAFTYTASDGRGGTSTVTVTVTIGAVNRPPVAVADSTTTTAGTAVVINPLTNDSDPDGNPLSITATTTPGHGTVTRTATQITYAPTAGYTGPDSFSYTISDGQGGTATATISVTVTSGNQPPVAVNDTKTATQDTPLTFDPRTNDSDPNGDPLTITGKTNGLHGTVTFTSSSVTYTPASGYTGADSFTYTISDGRGGSATATVNVTVNPSEGGDPCVPDPRTGVCEIGALTRYEWLQVPAGEAGRLELAGWAFKSGLG